MTQLEDNWPAFVANIKGIHLSADESQILFEFRGHPCSIPVPRVGPLTPNSLWIAKHYGATLDMQYPEESIV